MRQWVTLLLAAMITIFSAIPAVASEPDSGPKVMLLDRTVSGQVSITLDNNGNAKAVVGGRVVAMSELIKVRYANLETGSRGGLDTIEVHYVNGDVLQGLYDGGGREKLKFDNPFLGSRQESIEDLRAVFFSSRIPRNLRGFRESCLKRKNANDDLIFLTAEPDNPIEKTFSSFSPDAVGIVMDIGGNISVVYRDLKYITAVVFLQDPEDGETGKSGEGGVRETGGTGTGITVFLSDGSRITGNIRGLDSNKLTMTWLKGGELSIPVAAIATIYFSNPNYTSLSDLDPVEVNESLYFQKKQEWPWRRDRSVKFGMPLSIRGQAFHKGLGVHSRCELTYELGESYETFMATIGIDDEVVQEANGGREGNVEFRVTGDGRTLFEAKDVTVKDLPKAIRISVRGVKKLTLIVDFGKNFHVQDRADWAEPILIKKSE